MPEEKLLTVREVSVLLCISEKEVMGLAETGKIPAYKVGGVYLRFRRDQVLGYQKSSQPLNDVKTEGHSKNALQDKLSDFFYFNDFYIFAIAFIILLLVVILRG
ncbi:MAG: helix-turn-helix domain-containing protein [Candidatus Omnitrophica bacterium]|jgi:excisionase family DNA binding protein|nr:helix-turn-helix domain-containing protein [Candidatus Omnitrophota bacterium]